MPVIAEDNWLSNSPAARRVDSGAWRDEPANRLGLRIALINNMPDAALEDTEKQFSELLHRASGDIPVRIRLFSLPGVPRGERGIDRLNRFYSGFSDLWTWGCDAVIMTGTEPHHANLREEPYWSSLTEVLDWARRHTVSTVLSCLAAHAGVLHADGIARRPLRDKRFGLFEAGKKREHELTCGAEPPIRFPHSRWNEVRKEDLIACGYSVLTESAQAGVDSFVKKRGACLFVHLQGHPEYDALTLFKEYRRDVRRFIHRERETYPAMPVGYFDAAAAKCLFDFQERVLSDPRTDLVAEFPDDAAARLEKTWLNAAQRLYSNWIRYVVSRKARMPRMTAISRDHHAFEDQPVIAKAEHHHSPYWSGK